MNPKLSTSLASWGRVLQWQKSYKHMQTRNAHLLLPTRRLLLQVLGHYEISELRYSAVASSYVSQFVAVTAATELIQRKPARSGLHVSLFIESSIG